MTADTGTHFSTSASQMLFPRLGIIMP